MERKTRAYFHYDEDGKLNLSEGIQFIDCRIPDEWSIIQYKQVFIPLKRGIPYFRSGVPICYSVSRSGYARASRFIREKYLENVHSQ